MKVIGACAAFFGTIPIILFHEAGMLKPKKETGVMLIQYAVLGGFTSVVGFAGSVLCQELIVKYKYKKLKKALLNRCKTSKCKVEKVRVKSVRHREHEAFKVLYNDGFYFILDKDITAIEIQMKPITLEGLKKQEMRLKRDLFDLAKSQGIEAYRSTEFLSQGHINIGYESAFGGDELLFRNFVIDQLNHSELATGIFSNDNYNAKTPMKKAEKRVKLEKVIAQFDKGELSVADFSKKLQDIYGGSMTFMSLNTLFEKKSRNELKFAKNTRRVEIRAHRAQKDIKEFLLLVQIYEKRIEYLKQFREPIKFINSPPPRKLEDKVRNFEVYLKEMGEDPQSYKEIFPKKICRHFTE